MRKLHGKGTDRVLAFLFGLLNILLIFLFAISDDFLHWAFTRHQNQWSWYIRPFFLIPFCFSAYRHSFAGMLASVFLLFTSMFWFPEPDNIDPDVRMFLQFEINWLKSPWGAGKIFSLFLIPLSFTMLAVAFWKRSFPFGLAVLAFMALGKIAWSVWEGGSFGKSVIVPATAGLVVTSLLIYYAWRRVNSNG
ncbi:hypothetical protein DYBT9275_01561 [Dyadobacter sp. CECT 9275]|uniref:Uncharacterized protein n=1 Tax=Dyadobacter helix TaxID=2822344 RepID=A0A916JBG0_9BACT|nr:hypothetical protein [Dyadobacter sp. CECT 9275]CAG4995145.1 hypothetical protein DYBT9275_01561 [Dyadobacter sp. CECT 9275]